VLMMARMCMSYQVYQMPAGHLGSATSRPISACMSFRWKLGSLGGETLRSIGGKPGKGGVAVAARHLAGRSAINYSSRSKSGSILGLRMLRDDAIAKFVDETLLQRAIQTQLFYFQEFRDGFKKQWLEHFLGHEGLMNYHGFGGLQVSADEYLREMFNSPPVEHEVKMSWGSRLAGGSKDNPYLQQQPKYNYYMETVHPQKVCKGLMDIREQLRVEWLTDLPVMHAEDELFEEAFRRLEEAQEAAMIKMDSNSSTRTFRRRLGSAEKFSKQQQDEERFGTWNWDRYGTGGNEEGDAREK